MYPGLTPTSHRKSPLCLISKFLVQMWDLPWKENFPLRHLTKVSDYMPSAFLCFLLLIFHSILPCATQWGCMGQNASIHVSESDSCLRGQSKLYGSIPTAWKALKAFSVSSRVLSKLIGLTLSRLDFNLSIPPPPFVLAQHLPSACWPSCLSLQQQNWPLYHLAWVFWFLW